MDIFTKILNNELELILNEGLSIEINATIKHLVKDEIWVKEKEENMHGFEDGTCVIPEILQPLSIVASYDMGWNKWSTGWVYDSPSGHALMIGCHSGNITSFGVLAKKCAKCSRAARSGLDNSLPHVCTINHDGSSGSMETKLALQLTVDIFEHNNNNFYLHKLVIDDDSAMRSLLKHPLNHDKGQLLEKYYSKFF